MLRDIIYKTARNELYGLQCSNIVLLPIIKRTLEETKSILRAIENGNRTNAS
jgi:hypothetical protein